MHDRGFTDLTESDVDPRGREILAAMRAELGGVPRALARMVVSPALFDAFRTAAVAFEHTSLTPVERELAILVLARDFDCSVCRTMHSHIAAKVGARDVAARVLAGESLDDPRLAALEQFVREVVTTRADVSPATWDTFLAAGYTRAQALELLIGVGAYTMSTFANRLTGAHG